MTKTNSATMMILTRKTRKTSSGFRRAAPLHLFRPLGHLSSWKLFPIAVLLLILPGWLAQASANSPHPDQKRQPKAVAVLFGTVFTPQGFGMAGAEIAVRVAGEKPEKKPRWRASSDRRGEFAVQVPPGAEYEVTVTAPGYKDESRKVVPQEGVREDMVFRMQPAQKK